MLLTVYFLTLVGGPTTLELPMAQQNICYPPWDSKENPSFQQDELLLTKVVLVHVLWDLCSAPVS